MRGEDSTPDKTRHASHKADLKRMLAKQRILRVALQLSAHQPVMQTDLDKSGKLVIQKHSSFAESVKTKAGVTQRVYFAPEDTSKLIVAQKTALRKPNNSLHDNSWNQLGQLSGKYCDQLMPSNVIKIEEKAYTQLLNFKPKSRVVNRGVIDESGKWSVYRDTVLLKSRSKSLEIDSSSKFHRTDGHESGSTLENSFTKYSGFQKITLTSDEVVLGIEGEISTVAHVVGQTNNPEPSFPTMGRLGTMSSQSSHLTKKAEIKPALLRENKHESPRIPKTVRIQDRVSKIDTAPPNSSKLSRGLPKLLLPISTRKSEPEVSGSSGVLNQLHEHLNNSNIMTRSSSLDWSQVKQNRKELSTSFDMAALKTLTIGKLEPINSVQLTMSHFFKHVQKGSPFMRDRFREILACKRGRSPAVGRSTDVSATETQKEKTLLRARVLHPPTPKHTKVDHRPLSDEIFDEGRLGEAENVRLQMREVENKVADEVEMYGDIRGFNKQREFHVYKNTCGLNYSPPYRLQS